MAFIAGAYNVHYGSGAPLVGQIARGITLQYFVNKQLITGDNQALTPQDAVHQGHEVFMEFQMMEYDNANARAAFWPYDLTATGFGAQGIVGQLDVASSLAQPLLLDHVGPPNLGVGTTAENQPTTLTATFAILAEGFPIEMLFAPALREIPIRLRLYPDGSGNFFQTTQS